MPLSSGMAMSMTTTSGCSLAASSDGLAAILGFADDLDVGLQFQQGPQAFADDHVVFG
jgi:hypothetical protein